MKMYIKCVFLFFLALPLVGQATHSWGGYHWARTTSPFTLRLGDNMTTAAWKSYLTKATDDWNHPNLFGATFTPVLLNKVIGTSSKKNCSMVSGTVQVCNGGYGRNGWLGLATINISGGIHITQGTAKMNDSYFTTSYYNNPNEKQHVVCQEMAHCFGLDHQSENGDSLNTCMDYFFNTGTNALSTLSTRPNLHDFEELNIIYAQLDSFNSYLISSSPVLAMGPDPVDHNDPNTWGQMVSQTQNGRGTIYERITGPSSKSITHVTWTEEAVGDCPSCDHRYHRFE